MELCLAELSFVDLSFGSLEICSGLAESESVQSC
jgi:hypothetical protein